MREDVVGRANVEDTPELKAYYKDLEKYETGALWTVANKIEPWAAAIRFGAGALALPRSARARDAFGGARSPEKAGRRVIYLNNPGRRDVSAAVGWLYSGLQVMHPGEVASAHAHSASALAFHHGRLGGLHHRRWSQDDPRRARFRSDAERHVARAWRREQRFALHLAGRTGHSARQRIGSQFLCGASENPAGRVGLSRG